MEIYEGEQGRIPAILKPPHIPTIYFYLVLTLDKANKNEYIRIKTNTWEKQ
jgi:hypothetical protein